MIQQRRITNDDDNNSFITFFQTFTSSIFQIFLKYEVYYVETCQGKNKEKADKLNEIIINVFIKIIKPISINFQRNKFSLKIS
jgi:hypothetical protein